MNNPLEWDEADLLKLIEFKIQESLELDYKACGALDKLNNGKKNIVKEISKDVSAFANSAGGVIVYGILEKDNLPIDLDIGFDPKIISREWLEQVINSNIQRRISGVRINQIELSGERKGRVAYVVSIPQSIHAPHQAADKIFYKRFNYLSVAMEEYEIRDISRRNSSPDLELDVLLYGNGDLAKDTNGHPFIELQGLITNLSQTAAEYAVISIFIDDRLEIKETGGMKDYPTFMPFGNNKTLYVNRLELEWYIPQKMPIFNGHSYHVTEDRKFIKLNLPANAFEMNEKFLLASNIKAPGMTERYKKYIIQISKGVAEIKEVEDISEYFSIKNLHLT